MKQDECFSPSRGTIPEYCIQPGTDDAGASLVNPPQAILPRVSDEEFRKFGSFAERPIKALASMRTKTPVTLKSALFRSLICGHVVRID